MSSETCMTLGVSDGFQNRVDYFVKKAAIAVISEDTATINHIARVVFAAKVLRSANNKAAYSVGVCTNSTIAAAIGEQSIIDANLDVTDGDIEFTVNSLFNAYSTGY